MSRRTQHRRPTSRERGASIFIVVLVITVLTAVGIFAARSASQVNVASGHARQAMQALYFAEMGTELGIGEVNRAPSTAVDKAFNSKDYLTRACRVNKGLKLPCYRYMSTGDEGVVEAIRADMGDGALNLADPQTDTTPGSFGPALLEADSTSGSGTMNQGRSGEFIVELTDVFPQGTLAGNDVNNEHMQVMLGTVTGFGQVRTNPEAVATDAIEEWCGTEISARTATIMAVRGYVKLLVPR